MPANIVKVRQVEDHRIRVGGRLRVAFRYLKTIAVGLFLCVTAFSQARVSPTPELAGSEANLIHLGDVIDIDVEGNLEFDWRGPLTPEGFPAAGHDPDTYICPLPNGRRCRCRSCRLNTPRYYATQRYVFGY